MKTFIAKIGITIGLAIASLFGYHQSTVQFGGTLPINGSTYNLAGSGVTSSATSIVLSSFTIPQTGQQILDADVGDIFYITLEPGNRTRQEVISCTTVSGNTLSGCVRGLSPISPYTASTSLQFAHSGGSQVIFGDAAQLFNLYTAKANDETITGSWSFPAPTIGANPVTKTYADGLAFNGVATSSESQFGGVWLATQLISASSTDGSPNKPYVLYSKYSTSTPGTGCGLCTPITQNNGKLHQGFLDLTQTFSWSGLHTFTNGLTSLAADTKLGSTSIPILNIGIITSTSTATTVATSTITNLKISNNATTTRLWVSNGCVGCVVTTIVSGAMGNYDGGSPAKKTTALSCTAGLRAVGGGTSGTGGTGSGWVIESYPDSATSWTVTKNANGNGDTGTAGTLYVVCVTP